jgi:predicted house-cleaning NTP pyrophosphatase (Maf/HAM1 superfamily)
MLSGLCGSTHYVLTAVTIVCDGVETPHSFCEKTEVVEALRWHLSSSSSSLSSLSHFFFASESQVTFGAMPASFIEAYVATGEPMDKAGGYGIQVCFAASLLNPCSSACDCVVWMRFSVEFVWCGL